MTTHPTDHEGHAVTTPLEDNVVETYRLLDDTEDAGHTTVATRDVRRTLGGQPLDGDEPGPAAPRRPQPGDVVLIRATVDREQPWPDDTVNVTVLGRSDEHRIALRADRIATILGPSWMPPQPGDYAVDGDGDVWRWNGVNWRAVLNDMQRSTEWLLDHCGLTLIARDGKRWES